MKAFNHRVFNLLEQEETETAAPPSPEEGGDEKAFQATLDKGTNPQDFETKAPAGPSPEEVTRDREMTTLQEWIGKISEFITYLNGVDNDSMQKILNSAECDTLFADIARGERKRIARLAQDLSGLNESLKGYLLSSDEE
jgi:hypothetical protein